MRLVSDFMTRDPLYTVPPTASIEEAALRMKSANRGCLVVTPDEVPIGIITERDLVQRILANRVPPKEVPVSRIMSSPLVTVGPGTSIVEAAATMMKYRIRRLVVFEASEMVGILTVTDFARYLQLQHDPGPVVHASSRGAHLMSEIRTLPHKCPNCGVRLHVQLVGRKLEGASDGQEERMSVSYNQEGLAGGLPGQLTSENRGHFVLERLEKEFLCKHCGHKWTEESKTDVLLPEGTPIDACNYETQLTSRK